MLGTCKGSWAEPFIVCGTFPTQRWRLRVDGLSGRGQRMRLDPGAQRAEGARGSEAAGWAFHAGSRPGPSPATPRFLHL